MCTQVLIFVCTICTKLRLCILTCSRVQLLLLFPGAEAVFLVVVIGLVLGVAGVGAVVQLVLLPVLCSLVLSVALQFLVFFIAFLFDTFCFRLFQSFLRA